MATQEAVDALLLKGISCARIDISIKRDNGSSKKGLDRVILFLGHMTCHTCSSTIYLAYAITKRSPYVYVLSHERFAETNLFFLYFRLRVLI